MSTVFTYRGNVHYTTPYFQTAVVVFKIGNQ